MKIIHAIEETTCTSTWLKACELLAEQDDKTLYTLILGVHDYAAPQRQEMVQCRAFLTSAVSVATIESNPESTCKLLKIRVRGSDFSRIPVNLPDLGFRWYVWSIRSLQYFERVAVLATNRNAIIEIGLPLLIEFAREIERCVLNP
jgi:hypothetical protein